MSYAVVNPDVIYTVANGLLSSSVQVLSDNGLHVPSHKFVSWHYPVWDCCDHLVVHFTRIKKSTKGSRAATRREYRLTLLEVDLTVTLIGCAAVGDPFPSDTQINDNAQSMYTSSWTLYQGLICNWVPTFPATYGDGCRVITIGDMQVHPPMGGCESAEMTFNLEIS